jgi:hypothetical protein
MLSSFLLIKSKSEFPTTYQKRGGDKGTTKQQGAKRYLGGHESSKIWRSDNALVIVK